jgi:hypothetical protein
VDAKGSVQAQGDEEDGPARPVDALRLTLII